MEAIREAYEKREYTDVVVVCGDRTWDAHQVVVLKKSPYFKSNTKGNKVQLTNDDTDVVAATIHYCYYQTYPASMRRPSL